jgi:hypothetical protein
VDNFLIQSQIFFDIFPGWALHDDLSSSAYIRRSDLEAAELN